MDNFNSGVWFVYDGECPICNYAAHAFRIKKKYGELHLLNARAGSDHEILQEINRRRFDLDAGMVIVAGGKFYHGKTALQFMAQFGDEQGCFNRINTLLFRSSAISSLMYPWMRGARNVLIRIRRKGLIDNLRQGGG
jgi:predicted DCC family thiol-disulfide oxidoreductase YuxK